MATKSTNKPRRHPEKSKADIQVELSWIKNGEYPFWQLARLELLAKIQTMRRRQLTNQLFSNSEVESRREKALEHRNRPPHLSQRKLETIYRRLCVRSNKQFRLAQQRENSEAAERIKIAAAHPLSFFSSDEISNQLKPHRLKLKRTFRRHMAKVSRTFRDYLHWTAHLPEEDIDNEIASLKKRYVQIGRQREWYFAFMLMAESVVKESSHTVADQGMNEPATRILQQDFLQTMKSRYASY